MDTRLGVNMTSFTQNTSLLYSLGLRLIKQTNVPTHFSITLLKSHASPCSLLGVTEHLISLSDGVESLGALLHIVWVLVCEIIVREIL